MGWRLRAVGKRHTESLPFPDLAVPSVPNESRVWDQTGLAPASISPAVKQDPLGTEVEGGTWFLRRPMSIRVHLITPPCLCSLPVPPRLGILGQHRLLN